MKIKSILIYAVMAITLSSNALAYSVIPCGEAVGVIVKTEGVLVEGTTKITDENGHSVNPAKKSGIIKGDRVIMVNNKPINTSEELANSISETNREIQLTIVRNNKRKVIPVTPVKTTTGMKLGILVRDSAAGIGTITFVDPTTGIFAGLGHGICDLDSNTILPINGGNILKCELSLPTRGKIGFPGELNGEFIDRRIGTIETNMASGISGKLSDMPKENPVEICSPEDVQCGDAYIYSEVDNKGVEKFSIKILKINPDNSQGKNMTIEITDDRLISKTGGIVQGMSGSPILQNGKLVGAVTHVFVNNPKKGYGIFIENMMPETNNSN